MSFKGWSRSTRAAPCSEKRHHGSEKGHYVIIVPPTPPLILALPCSPRSSIQPPASPSPSSSPPSSLPHPLTSRKFLICLITSSIGLQGSQTPSLSIGWQDTAVAMQPLKCGRTSSTLGG